MFKKIQNDQRCIGPKMTDPDRNTKTGGKKSSFSPLWENSPRGRVVNVSPSCLVCGKSIHRLQHLNRPSPHPLFFCFFLFCFYSVGSYFFYLYYSKYYKVFLFVRCLFVVVGFFSIRILGLKKDFYVQLSGRFVSERLPKPGKILLKFWLTWLLFVLI